MDVNHRCYVLNDICSDYVKVEFIRDMNDEIVGIKEILQDRAPIEVVEAFKELEKIKKSGLLIPIR